MLALSPDQRQGLPGRLPEPRPQPDRTDLDAQGDVCDADDDNDTVADLTDFCSKLPGRAGNGCPRIARALSLRYAPRAGRFSGRLRPRNSCAGGQQVTILLAKRGKDRRIGRARTRASGGFQLRRRATSGRFYAKAGSRTIRDFGNCAATRSKRIRVG